MRVLVVGGGGREHALSWRLSLSPSVTELHVAPGSAAIARLATCHDVSAEDVSGQLEYWRNGLKPSWWLSGLRRRSLRGSPISCAKRGSLRSDPPLRPLNLRAAKRLPRQ